MPSPFPGMDPYLESPALWPDFHHEFASALRHVLHPLLPSRYFVKVLHRKVTEGVAPEELGVVVPDASVLARGGSGSSKDSGTRAGSTTTPVEVELELSVPGRQFYLEVTEARSDRLVTAIELVSPSNKRSGSRDRARYLRKRDAYLASEVHFLEVDLLRGGERWPAGREPEGAYRILLSRADRRPRAEVWPVALRQPLPIVPVPLLAGDADAALPLQEVFTRAYDGADYRRYVRYGEAVPHPPLSGEDLAWVRSCTRS